MKKIYWNSNVKLITGKLYTGHVNYFEIQYIFPGFLSYHFKLMCKPRRNPNTKIFMWLRENVWLSCYEKVSYFYVYVTHSASGNASNMSELYESRLVPLKNEQPWNDWGKKNRYFFFLLFCSKTTSWNIFFVFYLCSIAMFSAYIIFKHTFSLVGLLFRNWNVVTVTDEFRKFPQLSHKMNKCACTEKIN